MKATKSESISHAPGSRQLSARDPRRLLQAPFVYKTFQRAVGAEKARRHFIQDIVAPIVGTRILEVGCGPGNNCKWIPHGVDFVGCDTFTPYIEYAREHHGQWATFYDVGVEGLGALELGKFDVVLAIAMLHHIADSDVSTLCDHVYGLLKPGGSFMTADPCFVPGQGRVARYITSHDRGQFVRYPDEYRSLLEQRFEDVSLELIKRDLRIPGSSVVMKARR